MSNNSKDIMHVLVAHESAIVRSGLITILRQLKNVHVHPIEVLSLKAIDNCIKTQSVDVLFISPSFDMDFDLSFFKKKHPDIPVVAVLDRLYPSNTMCDYSGRITILDSVEKIEQVLLVLEQLQDTIETQQVQSFTTHSESDAPTVSIRKSQDSSSDNETLSAREKEIIIGIVEGLSNKEIADKLYLSIHTVITHRRNITRKLQIHSTAGLTIYAIVNGLVQIKEK